MPAMRPLRIFTATRPEQVPARCKRVLSVDGAVPGAVVTYDHHQTGERINLDAVPAFVDPTQFDGIATTLADADALVSAVAVLLGGPAALEPRTRAILEAASHRCDHLVAHPDHSLEIDALGRGLDNYVGGELARCPPSRRSARFASLVWEVFDAVKAGETLPCRAEPVWAEAVAEVVKAGHVTLDGDVLVVDLREHRRVRVRPDGWYLLRPECSVSVLVEGHPRGGPRYTVGRNPFREGKVDIRHALAALAAAEFAHGPPALRPEATPGSENWGGRREVGGSPWNYGSRLAVGEVVAALRMAMAPPRPHLG
ncbi:hypothetical protein LBMAG42_56040 [Deltaproteobacteria bacterium]|nr:hypothetical protein LBMAG42_56040 [Deltaproteobacteria bacterium]